jgi:hypothetical protein
MDGDARREKKRLCMLFGAVPKDYQRRRGWERKWCGWGRGKIFTRSIGAILRTQGAQTVGHIFSILKSIQLIP